MPPETLISPNRLQEKFVEEFAAKPDPAETDRGRTRGTAGGKGGKTAPASSARAQTDTTESETEEEETSSESPEEESGEETSEDEESEETSETEEESAAEEESGEEETEEEEKEGEEEETEESEEGDEADKAQAAEEKRLADDVKARLEKHGAKMTLDDVPKEFRPLVQKKLKDAEAGLTRALMEARGYRKEEREFRAEQLYRDQHPELVIADLLTKHPELVEKVNEWTEKLDDPDKKKLFDIELKGAREAAFKAVDQVAEHTERIGQRADQLEVYTSEACTALEIPFMPVANAIALALYKKHELHPDVDPDLTEAELDAVIEEQAKLLKPHIRAKVQEDRKKQIQQRTKDRKTTSPAIRAGSGARPAGPIGKRVPKNDKEFMDHMLAKL